MGLSLPKQIYSMKCEIVYSLIAFHHLVDLVVNIQVSSVVLQTQKSSGDQKKIQTRPELQKQRFLMGLPFPKQI